MDPGTALGVVSLAIQSCQSLHSAFSAWSSYDEDTKSLVQYIRQLHETLQTVKQTLDDTDTADSHLVQILCDSIPIRVARLNRLNGKINVASKPAAQANTASSSKPSLKDKYVDRKGKILYPFRKDDVRSIREDVRDVLQVLDLAMNAVQT